MNAPELSRLVDRRHLPATPIKIEADADERKALVRRFGLIAVHDLQASVTLERDGDAIDARGRLSASIVQACAVSGEDLPVRIDEPLAVRFVPAREVTEEEIELEEDELDEVPFEGHVFDLGEAVAQSLALAIDPYATGPEAERVRKEAGLSNEESSGPFAALAALKKD